MRKNKSVSFNLSDEKELKLHERATRINPLTNKPINFSDYVKELIAEDLRRIENGDANNKKIIDNEPIIRKEKDAYTLEAMGGFL